jgi:hypothetical protein
MSFGSRPEAWIAAALLLAAWPGAAAAQGMRETQVFAVATASRPAAGLLGLGFAVRDARRTRVGFALAAGVAEGSRAAGRGELMWHFLLDPVKRSGLAIYGGAGVAVSIVEGGNARPWAQAVLGAETTPAGRTGWFFEAGFGGGARAAMGLRFRSRRTPPSRP